MNKPRERIHTSAVLVAVALFGLALACKKDPPAVSPTAAAAQASADGAVAAPGPGADGGPAAQPAPPPIAPPKPGDLIATVETSMGTFQIRLFADKAPQTVANFVGLTDGTKPWRDVRAAQVVVSANPQAPLKAGAKAEPKPGARAAAPTLPEVKRPFFDGLAFFRVAPDFAIQSGDPLGDGTGGPGFTVPDELSPDLRHDRPGVVTMAHRGRGTAGSQFMILLRALPVLDGRNTVFGEVVSGLEVVRAISRVPAEKMRPLTPVLIRRVSVKKLA